jgi:DNA-binding NtrC family response regulator
VARAVHDLSSRAGHPFIAFNCSAVPRELIESQLFGHRKGAFTGASQDHQGVIRAAEGGTLLLDEIGDLPLEVQPKLLRFLQEGETQPLGESRPVRAEVRVIAATNRDLERMVAAGGFREDLYYRLNVIELRLPPLRERREEIPPLIEHFLQRYSDLAGREVVTIAPEALDLMMRYNWPGNVRQLENEIRRLVALTPAGEVATIDQLSPRLLQHAPAAGGLQPEAVTPPTQRMTMDEATAAFQLQMAREALARHQGNISKAAKDLGISRNGLKKLIGQHKLLPPH